MSPSAIDAGAKSGHNITNENSVNGTLRIGGEVDRPGPASAKTRPPTPKAEEVRFMCPELAPKVMLSCVLLGPALCAP